MTVKKNKKKLITILVLSLIILSSCHKTLYYGKNRYDYFDYYLKPYKNFSLGFYYDLNNQINVTIYNEKADTNKVSKFKIDIDDKFPLEFKINEEGYNEKKYYNLNDYTNLLNEISGKNYTTLILSYPNLKFNKKIKVHFQISLIYNNEMRDIDTTIILKRYKHSFLGLK